MGITYEQYLGLCKGAKLDPRNAPEPVVCDNALMLASWFKLFGYAARATREGAR